jgi:hypothetical protein
VSVTASAGSGAAITSSRYTASVTVRQMGLDKTRIRVLELEFLTRAAEVLYGIRVRKEST